MAAAGRRAGEGKELSIHNFEELDALHAIARILAQPRDLREQLEQATERTGMSSNESYKINLHKERI
ncbi:MAG: hypothetical protein KJ936_09820 [Proteobacteria bacterium]|nr:hypothetical protein [Pseudomonadota bacterium]MBU2227938.1 hypothetical protein [Pseudomonadota bacterium]